MGILHDPGFAWSCLRNWRRMVSVPCSCHVGIGIWIGLFPSNGCHPPSQNPHSSRDNSPRAFSSCSLRKCGKTSFPPPVLLSTLSPPVLLPTFAPPVLLPTFAPPVLLSTFSPPVLLSTFAPSVLLYPPVLLSRPRNEPNQARNYPSGWRQGSPSSQCRISQGGSQGGPQRGDVQGMRPEVSSATMSRGRYVAVH